MSYNTELLGFSEFDREWVIEKCQFSLKFIEDKRIENAKKEFQQIQEKYKNRNRLFRLFPMPKKFTSIEEYKKYIDRGLGNYDGTFGLPTAEEKELFYNLNRMTYVGLEKRIEIVLNMAMLSKEKKVWLSTQALNDLVNDLK